MNPFKLNKFREVISARRNALANWLNSSSGQEAYILANASDSEVLETIDLHDKALEQIEAGEFGKCTVCKEDVEADRLELDFTTCVCLDHYSEEQIRSLERDLELAARIQRQLLPTSAPSVPGAQIAAVSEPAEIVSGDYFDFFDSPDGFNGLVVADVMGKGLSSSMLMANIQASIRILGPEYSGLEALLARLNELFRYNLQLRSFISVFLARFNTHSGVLQYSNAGHNPAVFWNNSDRSALLLKPTGPAIGLTGNSSYSMREIPIHKGDMLLIYTDGLNEARNPGGEEFGETGIIDFMNEFHGLAADEFTRELRKTALDHAGKFHDDMTMITVKF